MALIGILSILLLVTIYNYGASSVEKKWTQERNATALIVAELKGKNQALADRYNTDTEALKNELKTQTTQYRESLANHKRTLDQRLLAVSTRADRYKRQAEGGEAERQRLVDYTVRLDRQLEEGIFVVNNLTELVRQRDRELNSAHQRLILRNNIME